MRPSLVLRQRIAATPQRKRGSTLLPLARQLTQSGRNQTAFAKRVDIVSPALCDDILSYVGSSLDQYKNCDIIDFCPGAGLWSSKVHDLLRPRRHVLLEPDEFYKPYLQPLLDAPRSTYIQGPASAKVLPTLAKTLEQGLLPDQHPLPKGDPRLNEPNTSLLFLLNLSRLEGRSLRESSATAREILSVLTKSARIRHGLGQYGQVRMLIWVGEEVRERLLPGSLKGLDIPTFFLQHYTRTHLIASHSSSRMPREETTLDIASAVRVADKMRSAGIEIPPHRQNRLHQIALSLLKDNNVEDVQAKLRADVMPRQQVMEEKEELETLLRSKKASLSNRGPWEERLDYLNAQTAKTKPYLLYRHVPKWQLADEVRRLELISVDETRPAQEQLAAKEQWERLQPEINKGLKRGQSTNILSAFQTTVDHRRAFYEDSAILKWDNRPFEPLETESPDFHPKRNLCLLDLVTLPPQREQTYRELEYTQRLASKLFARLSQPLPKSLDVVRLGSSEVILPQLTAAHDPKKGGSLDMDDLRVRMLTPEMVDELVDAWKNWTFRPEVLESELTERRAFYADFGDSSSLNFYYPTDE